ncbi:HsdR family type I site-specific deoxyribonuclease [Methylocaldum sp. 14B]|uniref:HsdR family type I site-specific deoxyribonuclease n=1 Tax=Methylocaldum sp. 14B TaxID=1912213 RepID=UPI00098A0F2D|nr:HsdR family type I site-specific deoxyribonuclease [Methylocaldum sp. 14B]
MSRISESEIETFAIELLERLGYQYIYAPDIAPDSETPERDRFEEVLLLERLRTAVARINPSIPADAREEAIKQIQRLNSPELITNNEAFHRMLTEGIKVIYQDKGHERGDLVWLVDFARPDNNEFIVANQFTVIENHQNKRPDVVLFVNGLPLVVMELKNAADENATIGAAYKQLQTYKAEIPSLFAYNGMLVISDGLEAKVGSLSAGFSRFMAWKTADGKLEASPLISQLETLVNGMLNRATLLDLLRHFIVFERTTVQKQPSLNPSQGEGSHYRERTTVQGQPSLSLSQGEGGHYRGGMDFVGLKKQVRELRKHQTKAEDVFWELVRNRQFLGLKFRRQHQFGHYAVDFYCHSENLVIEFDGEIHEQPEQKKKDEKRDKYLQSLGNKVLRFKNEDLLDDPESVFEQISKSLSPSGRDGREGGITTVTTIKKLAAYHQYYAVNAAVASTLRAASEATPGAAETPESYGMASVKTQPPGDRKAGVVWHTQGSGKSLSMVFYTGKIVLALDNPTIVVITDRNDLDDQLFDTFAACTQVLRQEPKQVEDRQQLKDLLKVASGGVIFTTIQKFQPDAGNVYEQLTDRRNVVVIADEAHRTQYGFKAKTVDEKDAQGNVTGKKIVYGFAKYLRDALPNATYLGFTGTPIEKTDVNTPAVFGNYIDVYDIAQAVEDGATKKIYYESRLAKVSLSEEGKKLIAELDEELEQDELTETQKAKTKWTQMESLVGAAQRIRNVAQDIVAHFEKRQEVFVGKGMIVAMSRRIAVELYDEIIKLRPRWHSDELTEGVIKVVMTASSSDGPKLAKHHTTKQQRKALAERMKDPYDGLKLVIVRDMWLTGFDAPCMHTLYIDKPMKGHNLMQAIARVNRVYGDKPAGLVVDYLGIASDLKQALSFYADAGGKGDPMLAQEQAVQLLLEKLEVVSQMFDGFAYEDYFEADTSGKLSMILAAEEYILGLEDGKKRYIDEVTALSQAFAIAIPHDQALDVKDEVAFFQAVKARLVKFDSTGFGRADGEIETTVRQVIDKALVSEQVIDVFDAAGIKKPDISILSEEFLLELKNKEHKNIALEVLKKLLNDEIRARAKKNLVESKRLLEMLEDAIKRYHAKVLTAAEVIEELINVSKEIVESDKQAEALGMSDYEYAFYTAVANNKSARELMQQDKLRELAVVLFERVKANASIDWTIKESVKAKLKVIVKRTLRQYGYPPDMQKLATETVLKQAEMLANEIAAGGVGV